MATKTGAKNSGPTKKELREREKNFLANAEAQLIEKHNTKKHQKVVPGSIKRGTGAHDGKLTVLVNTLGEDGKPDGKQLRVATSDVHQVNHQPDVAQALRRARRNERARQRRAEVSA